MKREYVFIIAKHVFYVKSLQTPFAKNVAWWKFTFLKNAGSACGQEQTTKSNSVTWQNGRTNGRTEWTKPIEPADQWTEWIDGLTKMDWPNRQSWDNQNEYDQIRQKNGRIEWIVWKSLPNGLLEWIGWATWIEISASHAGVFFLPCRDVPHGQYRSFNAAHVLLLWQAPVWKNGPLDTTKNQQQTPKNTKHPNNTQTK